jgi:oxygen-independent coproporphyrinogen III oxidase
MPLGLYISVPFCRTKCSYCNFASDVFSRAKFEHYIARLRAEIEYAKGNAEQMACLFDRRVDSIYFGGGTPTLLDVTQLENVFVTIRQNFLLQPQSEITVECAPGTLSGEMLKALVECGVNRVSLGVQSFVDEEAASVGRLHGRQTVIDDIARLRRAGITNINVDLIAGLPHQTRETWERSLDELIASEVSHASVYMLEVDEDSRLGRELIAGGQKYHAHFVPDEDLTADMYELACDRLNAAGIPQYEISNFARPGFESKHNIKYWTRLPYVGFGVDAHSMLPSQQTGAVRFSNTDSLERYLACEPPSSIGIDHETALEEKLFLGLRLVGGVDVDEIRRSSPDLFPRREGVIAELVDDGLLERHEANVRLTPRGRLLSNEVFEKFISSTAEI